MKTKKIIKILGDYPFIDSLVKGFPKLPLTIDNKVLGIAEEEKRSFFFSIVNQSANAVVITNADKDIIYANKKFEELSGYTLCEVLGKNPRVLKSNNTPVETYRDMYRTLNTGNSWKGVFLNVHRNGKEYIEEAVISPITSEAGKVICYLAEKKDITAQRAAENYIRKLTHYDGLTELPNRAYFIEEASKLINVEPNEENNFAILFADLDRFKDLNDSSGHLAGDIALKEVSRRIEQALPEDDLAARIGGDEFVVIHRRATQQSIAQLGKRLVAAMNRPISINAGQEAILGVSIGASTWPIDGTTLNEILSHADLAMYKAKSTERHFVTYTESIGTRFHRELELSSRLNQAIYYQDQFYLVYQPKLYIATAEVAGVEALLRWKEPELGSISPAEFIPIAEKHKLMCPIGKWVIKAVCKQLCQWQSEGRVIPGRVAINVSVQQLEHPDFFDDITDIIAEEGLSPNLFELEVTESVLMSNPDKTMLVLKELEQVGFCLSIDDFGTGFSSLSYLKRINAQILKIDKSFIDHLATSKHDEMIVKSVVDLAHNLGLSVVAEGVETEQQKRFLENVGCDMAQGYYYFKPVIADELMKKISINLF